MGTLPPRTITILSGFSRDRSGQQFNEGDLIASVTRLASAPVYGIARNWVGDGVVGGVTMDFADDGMRTGRLLVQVLDRAARGLPLPQHEVARPAQVVDWRQLQRWGLSESRVPPGTEILFRTPTVWERFRTLFLAIAAIIAVQSVLIALPLERRRRIRALHMVEESRDQLAHRTRRDPRRAEAAIYELTAHCHSCARGSGRDALDRTPSDLSEAREAFRDILSDDVRAVEVLDHIRALVRKDDPIDAAVDLNRICERSAELLRYDAVRRGVELRLCLEPGLPPVVGDAVHDWSPRPRRLALASAPGVYRTREVFWAPRRGAAGRWRSSCEIRAGPIARGAAACIRAVLFHEDARARDGSRHRAIDRRTTPGSCECGERGQRRCGLPSSTAGVRPRCAMTWPLAVEAGVRRLEVSR
jgi:signal transduction histidine kinase